MPHRYAIYFSPPTPSPLGAFGASWLGRTIEGQDLASPRLSGVSAQEWESATADPRRYGFHSTMKPPFRLADGCSESDLLAAVEKYCRNTPVVGLGQLLQAKISGFLALRPTREQAVSRLAADIVREFDPYRASLTPDEVTRRRPETLTSAQRDLLDRWGYPYVMGEFRFHMTLTGRLDVQSMERFETELEQSLPEALLRDVTIDDLCVFSEQEPGADLLLLKRFPLAGRS